MEVLNDCGALLSNYEVYKILKDTREEQKKIKNNIAKAKLRNLNTIAYETLKYFETISTCRFSSDAVIPDFVSAVNEYCLSKSELLQLINLRPATHVELHAIIEECEERYAENQIAELLELIRYHLHKSLRPRTSDSVCSYLSPTEDLDIACVENTQILHNSSLSHEEEVTDSSYIDKHTGKHRADKRKKKKKVTISDVPEDEPDDELSVVNRKKHGSKILVSDSEGGEDSQADDLLTCDVLPKEQLQALNEETKVKLKIKNTSKKFKKTESKSKNKRKSKRVSISEEIDVVNVL